MRALWLLVLGCSVPLPAAAVLYKTVDAAGNVTYTDRPQGPGQAALQLPSLNVSTPEARRQLDLAQQRWQREEQIEFDARMRRWAAAHRTAPVGYSRTLSPSTSRYVAGAYYPAYYVPTYFTYTTPALNAGSTSQSRTSQGLRPAGVHHRAHNARR